MINCRPRCHSTSSQKKGDHVEGKVAGKALPTSIIDPNATSTPYLIIEGKREKILRIEALFASTQKKRTPRACANTHVQDLYTGHTCLIFLELTHPLALAHRSSMP
eukprot:1159130-Pelagomonas_calceolata.AAC.7